MGKIKEVIDAFGEENIKVIKEEGMNELRVRTLKAEEIETRVQQCKEKGCVLLLYKDSRADMTILDDTFGIMGWKREHTRDNKNCIVSVWSTELNQWVSKEDTGTESNTEQQKGLASDSFKRACVNWGIGRELYSSPFTWISLNANEVKKNGNKYQLNFGVEFHVDTIEYDDSRKISKLIIKDKNGKVRFTMGGSQPKPKPTPKEPNSAEKASESQIGMIKKLFKEKNVSTTAQTTVLKNTYKVDKVEDLSKTDASKIIKNLQTKK